MEVLRGPVAVCVPRGGLALDRPFTYELPEGSEAGVGSLVEVPFHGRKIRGWVLGPTDDIPARILQVTKRVSAVRFFDEAMLELLRWVSERYVSPLATVIERSHPPRVASEEAAEGRLDPDLAGLQGGNLGSVDGRFRNDYRNGSRLAGALAGGAGTFVVRPAPADEQALAVEAVAGCVAGGRRAIVLVPEVEPLPATAAAVLEAFGDRAVLFAGGSKRDRYGSWLNIAAQRYDVVIGTRPAVFAPVSDLGLVYVSRESHALHREERAPYYNVRDVAIQRCARTGAVSVLAAFCPSVEASVLPGVVEVVPTRRTWPPVEVVPPGPEGRAPRLVSALKGAGGAFLFQSMRGYGVARVCRSCGEPAACPECGGVIRLERGTLSCTVCAAPGRCGSCGGTDLGVQRGGAERVGEWAARLTGLPATGEPPPMRGRVLVGGAETVKEVEPPNLDVVGILDADAARVRPGLSAAERALAQWMEAASWASGGGRVVVPTKEPGEPAVQSLVQGNPMRFHRAEIRRRTDAGFPPGFPVFRILGGPELPAELEALEPFHLLRSGTDETICLVTVHPEGLVAFGTGVRALAGRGIVRRVEAEPHL